MIPSILPTYARAPFSFTKGEGTWLIEEDGRRFLDLGAGIAVNALGHAHPSLVAALTEQAQNLWHVSNLYTIPQQTELADQLVAQSFADTVFFTNSGTESCELAVKMARKYWFEKGQSDRVEIITFSGSFHGRSSAGIAAAEFRWCPAPYQIPTPATPLLTLPSTYTTPSSARVRLLLPRWPPPPPPSFGCRDTVRFARTRRATSPRRIATSSDHSAGTTTRSVSAHPRRGAGAEAMRRGVCATRRRVLVFPSGPKLERAFLLLADHRLLKVFLTSHAERSAHARWFGSHNTAVLFKRD